MAYRKADPNANGGSSSATREIAALDFLLNIPLEAEQGIVRSGLEAEQNSIDVGNGIGIGDIDVGMGMGMGMDSNGDYEEEKMELQGHPNRTHNRNRPVETTIIGGGRDIYDDILERKIIGGTTMMTTTAEASASIVPGNNNNNNNSNNSSWWQPMIRKNKEFFSAEGERMKRRQQLELEMGTLEAPDGNALSAMEDGTLKRVSIENRNDRVGAAGAGPGAVPVGFGMHSSSFSQPLQPKNIINNNINQSTSTSFHGAAAAAAGVVDGNTILYGEAFIPGRRLDGYEATHVKIPREEAQTELKTTMRSVVRKAAVREWERKMINPSMNRNRSNRRNSSAADDDDEGEDGEQSLLDGRIFFSGMSSYPMAVFSVIKYEPKKEEEIRRRRKLEALGGGGSQFVMPSRDWRGVSYRALLPRVEKKNRAFNRIIEHGRKDAFARRKKRLIRKKMRERRNRKRKQKKEDRGGGTTSSRGDDNNNNEDHSHTNTSDESNTVSSDLSSDDVPFFGSERTIIESDIESKRSDDSNTMGDLSSSSEESTAYYPGFLDDPEMVQGRHRHVMVGDKITGCVVSSTIHFVSPVDLKAELNKQFRERFDQWEPPKPQRKYIGARVVDGFYTLVDPTESITLQEEDQRTSDDEGGTSSRRKRKSSLAAEIEIIRMPPSLTLSKIRSIKQQALLACVDCDIEVSTVALACVYFERLALDCRVDKTNRRLTFAACLLIAVKINEANVTLVHEQSNKTTKKGVGVLKSWIRPRRDNDGFASLLEFFAHEWSLSLKTLFAAEFGVFAALGFKLHATPSQVAFHFKRLTKKMEYSTRDYLGKEMYEQWQATLKEEARRKDEKQQRHEERQQRKEEQLLKLQHELQMRTEAKVQQNNTSIFSRVAHDNATEEFSPRETVEDSLSAAVGNADTPMKKKSGLNILNRIGLRKSVNNLNTLVSPHRTQKNNDELLKNETEHMIINKKEQLMRRSNSSPSFKRSAM
eukprot:CAMPEP_0203667182 /NCGR_PEP_ID=MMETSP0090-20130426/4061_1 /ASSEMBLY_ACC=CAM_ASM_001088 /TAXON_ID=426623 /ORGANISM="Chaetoceros affinis, Strain CCMP159" /LENGTH=981 /DNA_ID=CAMNT_0050531273 /DNA_START=18 /DNA_END=2963 /DNA_ORIENTATION=-